MANELEPNNSFNTADRLNIREITIGNLSGTSDVDFYRIDLLLPAELIIALNTPNDRSAFLREWDVVLYNSDGEVINARSIEENSSAEGGNKGAGDLGENLSFIEFANAFGVTDVLSLSGTQDGVSDIYIV
tara:strand:+ start:146 stop:538 length:393 start_codon:yes stop_codon:yes gene_type:complete